MTDVNVSWPAIIKHVDDDELVYIPDKHVWDNSDDLHTVQYDCGDILIDSMGMIFKLTDKTNDKVSPEPLSTTMVLHDILGLVKAHAALKGSCCVAKLYAPTINDAYKIIESMEDS